MGFSFENEVKVISFQQKRICFDANRVLLCGRIPSGN
jgi:hypothetical protein